MFIDEAIHHRALGARHHNFRDSTSLIALFSSAVQANAAYVLGLQLLKLSTLGYRHADVRSYTGRRSRC